VIAPGLDPSAGAGQVAELLIEFGLGLFPISGAFLIHRCAGVIKPSDSIGSQIAIFRLNVGRRIEKRIFAHQVGVMPFEVSDLLIDREETKETARTATRVVLRILQPYYLVCSSW